jgi:hypothetical protein
VNWVVFAIASWVLFGCEVGLRDVLQLGDSSIAPSFVIPLLVFVALWARAGSALTVALLIGLTLDLIHTWPTERGQDIVIVGPWSFGCMLAAYTTLNLRTMMFRKSIITVAILSVIGAAIAQIFGLALLTVRSTYDDILLPSAAAELWPRLASSIYTGATALLVAPVLQFIAPWLGMRRATGPAGALRFT